VNLCSNNWRASTKSLSVGKMAQSGDLEKLRVLALDPLARSSGPLTFARERRRGRVCGGWPSLNYCWPGGSSRLKASPCSKLLTAGKTEMPDRARPPSRAHPTAQCALRPRPRIGSLSEKVAVSLSVRSYGRPDLR
jgi:hypothetical protein